MLKTVRVLPDVLYQCLESDLFSYARKNEPLGPECNHLQFAAKALLGSFYKKFVEAKSDDADAKAAEKFLAVNDDCKNWCLPELTMFDEMLLTALRDEVYRFFYVKHGDTGAYLGDQPLITSFEQMLDFGRVGPGVSLGANGQDFYTKFFSSQLTTTSGFLYKVYKNWCSHRPLWRDAEELRYQNYGSAASVDSSKLSFVPKSADISRTICIEPSLNMFFQLGLEQILVERLRSHFGIDLSYQQRKNRELARLGSIDDSSGENFCTIDLSSASDSLSLKMLEYVFPPHVLCWFTALRTPYTTLPSGERVRLEMISTMGNGFTFPLQTILFTCVVLAAARVLEEHVVFPHGKRLGTFGVNGDDIICQRKLVRGVLRLLSLLGFKVNREKTFIEGPFRESCGHDYFSGHLVRGVYVKDLSHPASRYAVINALNLWTSRTGIPVPLTVSYLLASVRYLPVPLWENADAGIKVPFKHGELPRCDKTQSTLYVKMESSPQSLYVLEDGFRIPKGGKKRQYNPNGLLLAFLNGSVVGVNSPPVVGRILVRHDRRTYRTRRAVAPNWDYSELSSDIASEERGALWEWAVHENLSVK